MGLFDGKYSRKKYDKNSVSMKNAISELITFSVAYKAGYLLNKALLALDEEPVKMGRKRVMEAIDEHIFGILEKMEKDVKSNDQAMFAAHANSLAGIICKERLSGGTMYSADEAIIRERLNEYRALILNTLKRRDELSKKESEIEDRVKSLDEDSPKYTVSELEYTKIEYEMRFVNEDLHRYVHEYNNYVSCLNCRRLGVDYCILPAQLEFASFARETEMINFSEAHDLDKITDTELETPDSLSDERSREEPQGNINNSSVETIDGREDLLKQMKHDAD